MARLALALLALALLLPGAAPLATLQAQQSEPLYVVFIWHYHQPWYYSPDGSHFILPWVRMHSVGNYYKMAYILSKHPGVKVTFTFSGSLLVQLVDYINGMMDERQIISWKLANGTPLTLDEKFSMLSIPGGFFDINWARVVNVVPRYAELRDRAQKALAEYRSLPEEQYKERVVSEFTDQDLIDLAVLFNLFWMDPMVLREQYPQLYALRQSALKDPSIHYTRSDLADILKAQVEIMSKIIPAYRELAAKGQAELIPVPYSHPLAPIVVDFGWSEDLAVHVERSLRLFGELFNYTPQGVWPAEQAVNDRVLEVFAAAGFKWTTTDQSVLGKSGVDANDPANLLRPWTGAYNGRVIYVFFRNTTLSNLISFTYSSWNPQDAVNDLISRLVSLARQQPGGVAVIALDGENPWENYEEFGDTFLDKLYSALEDYQARGILRTTTPSEYLKIHSERAKPLPLGPRSVLDLEGRDISDIPISYFEDAYNELPRKTVPGQIAEGSWAGGELAIWIGQRQENAAWMLLAKARQDMLARLGVQSVREAAKLNPEAVENLLRAEASDWFWWYGGDGGGTFPANPLFKSYLRKIYESLGVSPPAYLEAMYNPDATPTGTINTAPPRPFAKPPKLDGQAAEWQGALNMSVGTNYYASVLVGVDSSNLYLALVPVNSSVYKLEDVWVAVYLTNPWRSVSPYHPGYNALARDGKDLGIGLFYEVAVKPAAREVIVSAADGRGGWTRLFWVSSVAWGPTVEVAIPWNMLSLRVGDIAYVTAAVYAGGEVVESSTRLGLTYYLQVPAPATAQAGRVVFEMDDPVGDDKGAGTYKYPLNSVFQPGVFDLTKFRVLDAGDRVVFEVYVRNLGGNPWNGPNGFSLQYVQIYVHVPGVTGRNDTFGLNVEIAGEHAWAFALLLTPGWGSSPVPEGERSALYYVNGSVVVQDGDFKVYADQARNAVIAEVSKDLLPGADKVDEWVYVVALTSYDGYGPDRIRPFGVEPGEWVVGVGVEHARAVALNVIPRIMDLLEPSAQAQYAMLSSYVINASTGQVKPAVVHGVGKTAQPPSPPQTATVTVTRTVTLSTTVTSTVTTERTVTSTVTETRSVTVGTTVPGRPSAATLLGVLIVGLVVGAVVAYIALRPRRA